MFEELGTEFTLLAFDVDDAAVAAFERAAHALGVPLTIIRDSFDGERAAYEARLVLVRPDQYVVWTGDCAPTSAETMVATVIGATTATGQSRVLR